MDAYRVESVVEAGKVVLTGLPFASGERVDVFVVPSNETSENEAWHRLAMANFLRGYSEEDAAYDNYDQWLSTRSAK